MVLVGSHDEACRPRQRAGASARPPFERAPAPCACAPCHSAPPNAANASMDPLLIPIPLLALLCFGIAMAYASVGLGGGTAYTAVLAILGASYQMIPTVSLLLNVVVTSIGSLVFLGARHGRAALVVPFAVTSVPAAYLGGWLAVAPDLFYGLLFAALLLAAARIFAWSEASLEINLNRRQEVAVSLVLGTVLGLVAGTVGIGGGIFLVPLVVILGLGSEREAAAVGAVFTWINSLAGLAARLDRLPVDWMDLAPLAGAVAVGALLGAWMGASWLSRETMRRVLGGIILVALVLLLDKVFGL